MRAIVAGPDERDIAAAIERAGHEVARIDVANRPALEEAGIVDADAYVLTEAAQATSIAVAKDLNERLKTVVYDTESLPDFARGQADLVVDPDLLDPEAVAAEL
jgi:Trk K+ transport system NAD-binding subunit